ncbi:hypothetical protein V6N11_043814 [Hibiscus sabdariffa]|uniref:Uncharacterized protein n=1 Tax=Hibiscus sabdariffa TaxID=183260 RepID=A0ABR2RDD1_9ROSI
MRGAHISLQPKNFKHVNKTIGEGSKVGESELQAWDDSLNYSELTRQVDLDKVCQIRKSLQKSDSILGLSKDPGFQGILAEWSPKAQFVYQNKTNTLCLSGGLLPWNRSLIHSNQHVNDPTYNKGKKIVESSEGEAKDKVEDLMSDYLQDMDISNSRKRKLEETDGFAFSAAKKTGTYESN